MAKKRSLSERMIARMRIKLDLAKGYHKAKANQAALGAHQVRLFRWRARLDDRVRPSHRRLHGRIFAVSGGAPGEGFPGEAPRCRCEAVPLGSWTAPTLNAVASSGGGDPGKGSGGAGGSGGGGGTPPGGSGGGPPPGSPPGGGPPDDPGIVDVRDVPDKAVAIQKDDHFSMKRVRIQQVPEAAFFWRRNDPRRWERLGEYGATDDRPTRPVPLPPLDEIVLLDPMLCEECGAEQAWPPVGPCVQCGHIDPEKVDRETIKAAIRDWSGQPDPHI